MRRKRCGVVLQAILCLKAATTVADAAVDGALDASSARAVDGALDSSARAVDGTLDPSSARAEHACANAANATARFDELDSLVAVARHPVADLASAAGRALVARARDDLAREGCASFAEFLAPAALADAAAEARAAAPAAFATDDWHNARGPVP